MRELHVEQGLSAINWETMGRATEVDTDHLNAGSYYMRKAGAGEIELKPLEVIFLLGKEECFFADSTGGTISTACDSWIMGIEK